MPIQDRFRSGWGRALVACMMLAGLYSPTVASAQTCQPEWRWVTGSITIGDGSVPTGNAWLNSAPCPQGPNCVEYPPVPGNWTYKQLIYEGQYTFTAQLSPYFTQTGVGGATCTRDQPPLPPCVHCSGAFDFVLMSRQGLIEGHVYKLPDFTPVAAQIMAVDGGFIAYTTSRPSDGFFTWRPAGSPNNWGLSLYTTPGPRTYYVRPFGTPADQGVPATINSNRVVHRDLALYNTQEFEPPSRCSSGTENAPSPNGGASSSTGSTVTPSAPACTVGCPVSVTTGNMDLDQTDSVIPGVGLGLRFSRSYNSHNALSAARSGVFGRGWTHSYEKRLTFPNTKVILLRGGDGQASYFQDNDVNGSYLASAPFTNENWIEKQSATVFVRRFRRGGSERYEVLTAGTASLTALTDAAGNATTLGYVAGKLATITDSGGRQLTLTYNGAQIQQLSGPDGPIATFTYIALGGSLGSALRTVTYADRDGDGQPDGSFTFAYHPSPNGRLWTVTDGAGKVLETHVYDANGRVTETKVSGDVRKYILDYSQANKTTVTDALGNVTTYQWAEIWGSRRILNITGPCASCGGAGGDVQEWTYDARGRVTSHKDGEGNVTTYEYGGGESNADGNVTAVQQPAPSPGLPGPRTVFTYHPDGRMHTRTAPNGGVTTWTYVAAGPQTITQTVSYGVNRTTSITYTPQGKPHLVTDPTSRQTEMHYNAMGDMDWTRDPGGHQTSFEYDAMGRLEKTILPATTPPNDSPRTSYDTLGRVSQVTNPNASYWRHSYDGGGRRILTRDPEANETEFQYDAYGRLSAVVDALGGTTEYGYDLTSNLVSLTDARDKTTSFEYDGYHRVKKTTYPSGITPPPSEQFTYDPAGRLKTRTDRKGVTTTLAYDGQGRLTGKTYSDGSPAVSYGYDASGDVGFMTSASNSADTLTWDFDLAGQLVSEASTRNASTVSYAYDLAGRGTSLRLNGAEVLTYGYEPDGQLGTITRAPGVVFDFNPDAAHRRQSIVFPNGTTTEYEYDLLSRLSRIRLRRGTTVLSDIAYESNDLNNRTSRTEDGTRLQYGYDELSRLLTVDRTLPTPTVRQEEYSYDPVGNRLTALGIPGLWTYGEGSELLSYNAITFGYDPNGNQMSRSGSPARTYVWDVENRLASARDNGVSVASFEYDPLGRRVAKTTPAGTTLFTYDGGAILVENGTSGVDLYAQGPGIDEPLARGSVAGLLTRFYHLDGLASLIKRTDGSGNVENSRTYDSFGQPTVTPPSGYAFTGREWDSESGIYYYRARYYDARIGRFLSQDPLRQRAGTNMYQYVRNRPTQFRDPKGLFEWPWIPTESFPYEPSCIYRKDSCPEESCDCETSWLRSRECPSSNPDDNKLCYFKWTRPGCLDRWDECPGAPEIDEITPLPPPGFRYFETMDPCFESEEPPQ